jgi:hypothetical protein
MYLPYLVTDWLLNAMLLGVVVLMALGAVALWREIRRR